MNIFTALKEDHREIKSYCDTLKDTTERAVKTRTEIFEKLRALLEAHSHAEEHTFYEAIKDSKEARSHVLEGEQEHHVAETLLHEISALSVDDEIWTAKVEVLSEALEHHIKEEEGEIFEKAREELSREDAVRIGEEFLREKEALLAKESQLAG